MEIAKLQMLTLLHWGLSINIKSEVMGPTVWEGYIVVPSKYNSINK